MRYGRVIVWSCNGLLSVALVKNSTVLCCKGNVQNGGVTY